MNKLHKGSTEFISIFLETPRQSWIFLINSKQIQDISNMLLDNLDISNKLLKTILDITNILWDTLGY
jgi:hypothetical protein